MFHSLSGNDIALFISVFLACAVEAVEAVTIVLAAGHSRDWRSAFTGVIFALLLLAGLILILGPSISLLPENALRIIVGGLLLVFGMQWLRKAILRASGYKALHDEDKIYLDEIEAAKKVKPVSRVGVKDWYSFTLSFKGVLLEGLEVVFIVLTFGAIQRKSNVHAYSIAIFAAALAVVIVTVAGFLIHKPLSKVPENTMKFIVGTMLTSFGIFWGSEGAGAHWPKSDLSLLGIIPFVLIISYANIQFLKMRKAKNLPRSKGKVAWTPKPANLESHVVMKSITEFWLFWYDFIIGDDWRVAAGTFVAFALIHIGGASTWWLMPMAVFLMLTLTLNEATRAKQPVS